MMRSPENPYYCLRIQGTRGWSASQLNPSGDDVQNVARNWLRVGGLTVRVGWSLRSDRATECSRAPVFERPSPLPSDQEGCAGLPVNAQCLCPPDRLERIMRTPQCPLKLKI